ncbi:flagellar basal body rod protein FlgB [Christensenella tenuis]|jgi:flagellar basal-body rod protein FlgB|uniref:Flagellar basal body rod protein FlgB n=1 Tax=Christensenella tenuis TaxID=2763033 RepID=A0ABR7EAD5_9FIRM|nr:flagellar basal body rod protein FlgB [Christensenella tenuis]MBC5646742.1 flagellar basal body rod protein FlgB [Christensenella tenuis]
MGMFDSLKGLENGIAASWLRNETILNNVANNDTPDFKASGVEFEELYKQALGDDDFQFKQTRETHMPIGGTGDADGVQGVVVPKADTTYRMDGNNVDIDQEMTDFAKNVIYYNTLMRKINGQFTQLRMAIKGQ